MAYLSNFIPDYQHATYCPLSNLPKEVGLANRTPPGIMTILIMDSLNLCLNYINAFYQCDPYNIH